MAAAGGNFHNLGTLSIKSLQAFWEECRHMLVFQPLHGTAQTIRMGSEQSGGVVRDHVVHMVLQCVGAERVSSAYLLWGKQGGPTQVAQKCKRKFPIGEQEPNEETFECTPGTTQGIRRFQECTKHRRQPSSGELTRACY